MFSLFICLLYLFFVEGFHLLAVLFVMATGAYECSSQLDSILISSPQLLEFSYNYHHLLLQCLFFFLTTDRLLIWPLQPLICYPLTSAKAR